MKHIFFVVVGTICLMIGALGLIIPLIPGFLFLLIAAAMFAQLSPRVRHRLARNPRLARFFERIESSHHLNWVDQLKLTFLASIEAITKPAR